MFATRIKSVMAAVLVVGLPLGGIGAVVGHSTAQAGKAGPAGPDGTRKRLKDPAPEVRLNAAIDLSGQLDEEAINVLIELLAVLPAPQRRQAALALQGVAEEWSPNSALAGDDEISRRILRDAWAGWWRNVDGPALLAAFQKRTLSPAQTVKAMSRIADLDDDEFEARQRAAEEIVALGMPIVPLLRQALSGASLERSRRIEQCLQEIARAPDAQALPAVAARLLALRKPAGAIETLLAYVAFTDDDVMKAEVTTALHRLAGASVPPDASLAKALNDTLPVRRAIAGAVLAAVTDAEVRAAVRKRLADPDRSVRLRVTVALACAADREAVPVLIDLIGDLPGSERWQAEEILHRLAGATAPQMEPGEDAAARTKYRDAWKTWWKDNAATTKLASLPVPPPFLGFSVIAAIADANPSNSRVLEVDRNGKVRWQFDGANYPMDVHVLPGNRVLVAENGARITERNFGGDILWQKNDLPAQPLNVQRLVNGNTFVCTKAGLMEFDNAGKTVLDIKVDGPLAACKTPDGQMIYLTPNGACTRLDAAGKQVQRFASGGTPESAIDLTPRGRILVDHLQPKAVAEFDLQGNLLWQTSVTTSSTAVRNGLVLAANWSDSHVAEFDRAGRMVWQYQLPTGYKPWRAHKR